MSIYANDNKKQDGEAASQTLNISYTNGARISQTNPNNYTAKSTASMTTASSLLMKNAVGIPPEQEINGTSGRDHLYGGRYSDDYIYGGAGDDYLNGRGGDDFLRGGRGNDYLIGGDGADTYYWGLGGGNDQIYDYSYRDRLTGDEDTLIIAGVEAEDINWSRSNYDLVASFQAPDGSQQSLTIRYWYRGEDYQIDTIVLDDGEIIDVSDIRFTKLGTEGNDGLYGTNAGEILKGLGGNDFLSGGGGDDLLIGGAGNDRLYGGAGNDTYVWGLGDGNDQIYDSSYADKMNGATDTLVFGEGINAADISWSRSNYNLQASVINADGEQQTLTLAYWFYNADYQLERVQLHNGQQLDLSNLSFSLTGTAANDTLQGTHGAETIYGLAGDDQLLGRGGDDRLIGGAGNDTLKGGMGNDTYVWGLGDGNDWIEDNDQQHYCVTDYHDVVEFGAGISADDIAWSRQGNHLVANVEHAGVTQSLTLGNWFYGERYQVEELRLADGKSIDVDSISLVIQGTNKADYLSGTDANETIYGLQGNDLMLAMGGNDDLYGGAGNDRMYFYGDGEHSAEGGRGSDIFILDTFFSGSTYVKDFNVFNNDEIDLSRILRNAQHHGEELIEEIELSDTQMQLIFFNGAELVVDASAGGLLDYVDEHLILGA